MSHYTDIEMVQEILKTSKYIDIWYIYDIIDIKTAKINHKPFYS